ncbi:hypothetical protein TGAMA5MH_09484 [Trichoderma gamsii]|uniref:Mid2 domain-containing protein n=1 Tax=Trichoderma gamsii TaxID=398673 RepID=A0A2K0SZB0_9HYPO|nr:hypothetical protein TGAMA5MH_09484 [Trichoderma gamsii]
MSFRSLLFATLLYTLFSHVASSALTVRNLPGKSSEETITEVRRRLASVKRNGTDVLFDNSTSFSLDFDGVTIFKYPFDSSDSIISITCTKCYFTGHASAKVTSKRSVNATSTMDQIEDSFKSVFNNIETYAENVIDTFKDDLEDGKSLSKSWQDVETLPPPDIDFNLDLKFPEYHVDVNLTDVEIYMQIDTVLADGITYTFNIYQSKTLAGVALGNGLLLGAVFSVDLIFSVNGQIDIQSGFHIHFDKVRTQIELFGKEASELDFDGGKFAFLPVSIQSGNVVLEAVLRLEARLGISLHDFPSPNKDLDIGAGVEARIYANIAEFVTNITLGEVDSLKKRDDDSDNCRLSIAQAYTFGIGAGAGASLVVLSNTWGPTPETQIPIFYTTLAQACVVTSTTGTSTVSATTTNAIAKRSVTSTVTTETQIATVCASPGLINCPASLQSLTKNLITRTLTSSVASGAPVVWSTGPTSTFQKVDFPTDAVTMTSSSGKPKSYTPPPPPPTTTASSSSSSLPNGSDASSGAKSGKHRVSNAVIIGVSVGLGVPVLLAVIAAIIYFVRRNRKSPLTLQPADTDPVMTKAQPVVTTYTAVRPEDDL